MDASTSRAIGEAAAALKRAERVVAITGAGVSAESGIPTFRGAGGLWRTFRAEDLATPEAFARDPLLVWEWYWWRRGLVAAARPNAGHLALARFEARFPSFALLTQNVDGLHRDAGSRNLVELHGNIWRARCNVHPRSVVDQRSAPIPVVAEMRAAPIAPAPGAAAGVSLAPCPVCGAALRPDVVWFGEALDPATVERATDAVRSCQALLVIGTSGLVYPVAAFPWIARHEGATVIEVNVERTPLTSEADIVLQGPSGTILSEVERQL